MRPLPSLLSVTATAGLVLSLGACGGTIPVAASTADAQASAAAALGARDIDPIVFRDSAAHRTVTCDKIIPDYDTSAVRGAPGQIGKIQEEDTVSLVHCTMDFEDDSAYEAFGGDDLNIRLEAGPGDETFQMRYSSLEEKLLPSQGLAVFDNSDMGKTSVDGWIIILRRGQGSELPEHGTTMVYERGRGIAVSGDQTAIEYTESHEVTFK
ncbi:MULTISPECIES: hypothetical protein [Actinomyces]|uniref:Lipoprotein n=1 Tax=Actinomyces marmotae TaxID=2737173 RepID=A0A6M8B6B5_9ACTO|nr:MULTISPECIES: hypothetical protein [Actinomyces]QKD80130.1 hypothetical protein HPC72_07795 [Actinomyces marmotae]